MTTTSIDVQELRKRIGEKAKADPHHRFWGLYTHVWKLDTLEEAYRLAKKNNGASGVDGVTFRQIEATGRAQFLETLCRELQDTSYRPLPRRQVTTVCSAVARQPAARRARTVQRLRRARVERGSPAGAAAASRRRPSSARTARAIRGGDLIDLSIALINQLKGKLSEADAVTQLSSGNRIVSHDGYPTIGSSQVALRMKTMRAAGAVRNALYAALLGKAGDATKIRPNATVVIIIATDEAPRELKGGKYRGIVGPEYKAEGCNLVADSQQQVDQYLKLWVDLFTGKDPLWKEQAKATVHLIGGLCTSTCKPEIAHGYLELVRATGGLTADICQENLGATLQIIIDSISGAASKAVLQYVPISASLAVALEDRTLERSRVTGFDYVGFSNSVVFVGVKSNPGDQVVASYRRWVKQATIR